ncbi:hypothetical protein IQ277_19435 [Nostocales cyanobacterium LEGE 12452]|nr:hypothetical protein [Nostocales cyanobacterium LEGE 12452]
MKSPILFKTLTLLSLFLLIPFSMIANVPVIANTLNTPTNTEQPKRLKRTLSGHTAPVRALTLSASGQVLASGSDDKTIKLWNATTGALLYTLTGHREGIKSIVFTPDEQTLISTSFDNTIKFWNT